MKNTPFEIDGLQVKIFPTRADMGSAAAFEAIANLRAVIRKQGAARIILASAPSQNELIAGLASAPDINWALVTIFHMDEYIGLPATHPATFRNYQMGHLLDRVTPAAFHGIRGESSDANAECGRYAKLLAEAPIDLVCMGIGENGHIAFNDPPVADFADPLPVKIVELDETCRQQQVNDSCFPGLDSVPCHAITLTCPTLLSAKTIICVVPGARKAGAVAAALKGKISTTCPASILRRHAHACLYLDKDAASNI